MKKRERSRAEKIWRALLVLLVMVEFGLLGGFGYQLYFQELRFERYQVGALLFLSVWIYIAYLKQRTADVSKIALDEKVKTHALLASLPYGTIVLDAENNFLYANPQAGELFEADPLLEQSPINLLGDEGKRLLEEDRWGSYETSLHDGSPIVLTLLPIKESKGMTVGKLVTIQERELTSNKDEENSSGAEADKSLNLFMHSLEKELKIKAPELYEKSRMELLVIETSFEREKLLKQLHASDDITEKGANASFTTLLAEVIGEVKKGYAAHKCVVKLQKIDSFALPAPEFSRYVLKELLLNALLFSPDHSEVLIGATNQNGAFRITITDSGQGVEQSLLAKVFDDGVKTDEGACKSFRNGRGLFAVKSILDELGIMIRLDSAESGGVIVVLDGLTETEKGEGS